MSAYIYLFSSALLINIPLGYLRGNVRKFSMLWFFWIHASIPVIILLRYTWHIASWFIPFSIFAAISGQLIGHRLWTHQKESYDR